MPFFSSWIKVIFITALAFSLYFGNSHALAKTERKPPHCKSYYGKVLCPSKQDPICASRGRIFYNECLFCRTVLESYRPPKFRHFGKC